MTSTADIIPEQKPGNPARRRFLGTALLGAAAWNLGTTWSSPAKAAAADCVNCSTAPAAFMEVSQALCGRAHREPGLANRLYKAMSEDNADFATELDKLASFMRQPGHDVAQLQASLDTAQSSFAALPRRIVTAWYTGIVGDGEKARCIAYEEALMSITVADQLRPPSYAYGIYGSWANQPATA